MTATIDNKQIIQDKLDAYQSFLESKIVKADYFGFEVAGVDIHPILKPHQRDTVTWCLKGGRRAIFSSFGLGKTITQLEICRQVYLKTGGCSIVVIPLGVRQEFKRDAKELLGIEIEYVRTHCEAIEASKRTPYLMTNYERVRDGNIDIDFLIQDINLKCASLDEASVLRSYGSKTYQVFLEFFKNLPFRFTATATPAPNKVKEIIHYAGYLGVMDTSEALTRFFQRDSTKANKLTIYPHKEREFWLWVSSWAIFINKPSDLGYSDEGYDLPGLKVHWHCIPVDHSTAGVDSWGNIKMFRDAALSLQDASKEKRDSIADRLAKSVKIMETEDSKKHWLLWHHREDERKLIQKVIPQAHTIYGSQDLDEREKLTIGFANGEYETLATKPSLNGSGCNFQAYCADAIFMGIDHKFNDIIQAIHRILRFNQTKVVNIHFIYTESEESVRKSIEKKWKQYDYMVENMSAIIRKYGLSQSGISELKRTIGAERTITQGQFYIAINNDNVPELINTSDNSVDFIHSSIPFSDHYEYSPSYNDFGHNKGNEGFFRQMDFLTPECHRVLKPGRVAAIHVKDRIRYGNVTGKGMSTVDRFSDKTADHFEKHGFEFFGRITIVTDVVRENNQTYRLGWSEKCKDGTKMGVGSPEYILLFRKLPTDTSKAYADTPVTKKKEEYTRAQWQLDAHSFWRSSGNRLFTPEELANMSMKKIKAWWKQYSLNEIYDYETHLQIGKELEKRGQLPASFMLFAPQSFDENCWTDIVRMRTLNTNQSQKRQQNHICPLQIDVVQRLINRFSNEGEIVLDPFGGIMTVPYCAVQMGRIGVGIELNNQYWFDGCQYLKAAEYKKTVPTLFDLEELAA